MSNSNKRIFWIVADSLGVGALPDAKDFKPLPGGDVNANTLWHIIDKTGELKAPHLQKMGLANTLVTNETPQGHPSFPPLLQTSASFGRMQEVSAGKDTPSGHWEMTGCPVPYQMPVHYDGLPKAMLQKLITRCTENGIDLPGLLGGQPASGTQIIAELGEEHVKSGKPIVYTSGDSVFQIAAHEESFGLAKLLKVCEICRAMLNEDKDKIGRVIARPFIGESASTFRRTPNRRDYSLKPLQRTVLNATQEAGLEVISIGKIADIFADEGITQKIKSKCNTESMSILTELAAKKDWQGIAFANLTDFDMLYGHRRDPAGYAKALVEMDQQMPKLMDQLSENDLVLITADHGCDPTFPGSDHTREYVPIIVYQKNKTGKDLGTRKTFADCAATVTEFLNLDYKTDALSMLS